MESLGILHEAMAEVESTGWGLKEGRFAWLSRVEYLRAWELQRALARGRAAEAIRDTLLLLEHPPTFTLGRRGDEKHILVPRETLEREGTAVHRIDRGGDVTFHGPGQLVGYPVIGLKGRQGGPRRYLRDLEEVAILALDRHGVKGERIEGNTGVWVGEEKIAAIGVKIDANRVTQHGFALNVSTDLAFFTRIIPCGIRGRGVTSMDRVLGMAVELEDIVESVAHAFSRVFGMPMVKVHPDSVWEIMKGDSFATRGFMEAPAP